MLVFCLALMSSNAIATTSGGLKSQHVSPRLVMCGRRGSCMASAWVRPSSLQISARFSRWLVLRDDASTVALLHATLDHCLQTSRAAASDGKSSWLKTTPITSSAVFAHMWVVLTKQAKLQLNQDHRHSLLPSCLFAASHVLFSDESSGQEQVFTPPCSPSSASSSSCRAPRPRPHSSSSSARARARARARTRARAQARARARPARLPPH